MLQKWQQILSLYWTCYPCHYPPSGDIPSMGQTQAPGLWPQEVHWSCIQSLKPHIQPDCWHMRLRSCEQAGPTRPSMAFVLWEPVPQTSWWGIETGTQAESQVPSPSKAECLCCSEVRPRLESYPDHLPAMELWVATALAFSASLSACRWLHLVPVIHRESQHTKPLSSLSTSVRLPKSGASHATSCWEST